MIRVLIADDHAVVRQGLKQIISEQSDMTVSGEAENANELMELIQRKPLDLIILDMSMPGRSGLEALKDIHAENPRLPVLILSMLPEEQFAKRALRAGAAGYMTKESAPEDLVRAIRKIYNGGKYISQTLAERLATELNSETDRPSHERLSDREFQVLLKLAAGRTVSEIAADLSLSAKTITTYRTRILNKMNMKSNAELVKYVLEHHLMS